MTLLWLHIVLFFSGLSGLYFGAEWLVKGASRFASSFQIRPMVIGLTIIAFGTSAPELVTGVIAGIKNLNDIVLGNVIGSNIANIGLVLGITAIVYPLTIEWAAIYREMPIIIGISLLLYFMGWDGIISRLEGSILFSGIIAYTYYMYRISARESKDKEQTYENYIEPDSNLVKDIFLFVIGFAALIGGAHLLVHAAVFIATVMGVSELVVGLTIVAVGTSLPELAICVVAAVQKESDISVGNVLGSNIYNILVVIGITAIICPLRFNPVSLRFDMPVMLLFSILLIPMVTWRFALSRLQGALLLVGYFVYIAILYKNYFLS